MSDTPAPSSAHTSQVPETTSPAPSSAHTSQVLGDTFIIPASVFGEEVPIHIETKDTENAYWLKEDSWKDLAERYYARKLFWLLKTPTIFTQPYSDWNDEKFTQETVKSSKLVFTDDSSPFQLKVRLETKDNGIVYESGQVISPYVYLTELHAEDAQRKIVIDWGRATEENNPNYKLMHETIDARQRASKRKSPPPTTEDDQSLAAPTKKSHTA